MKNLIFKSRFLVLLVGLLTMCVTQVWGESTTIYLENFGTTGSNTAISSYTGWSSSLITPTGIGTTDIRTTSASSGTGFSGGCNAMLNATTKGIQFTFGNKLSSYTNVKLTIGIKKATKASNALGLECYFSKDGGVTWDATGKFGTSYNSKAAVWFLTDEIEIPSDYLANFAFKIVSSDSNDKRIDDVKIIGESGADTRTAVNMSTFTATNTTLLVGESTTTNVINDQAGWTAAYTYESNNTSVATVNSTGVITAKAKGSATITARLNVANDDANYKLGSTTSKTVTITVNNPQRTAHFFINGIEDEGKKISVEDGSKLGTLPTATPCDLVDYKYFVGWSASTISGTTKTIPTFINENTTISGSDQNYYAVFAKGEEFSFAAADNSTYTTSGLTFTDKSTNVVLTLSAGSRYTSGTPNTFSVTAGTSNYFQISHATQLIGSVTATISASGYVINTVTQGKLSTSSLTQTVIGINAKSVQCKATSSKQIRATVISGSTYTDD